MLQCRSCNTRYRPGLDACPSCGRRGAGATVVGGESGPLSQPTDLMADARDEIDIDLDEDSVVGMKPLTEAPQKPPRAKDGGTKAAPAPRSAPPAAVPRASSGSPAAASAPAAAALDVDVEIDAGQVRKMLAEQPDLLEKGLGLHADEDGEPLGIDFPTPVGSIDLLGRDRKGDFVIVHVPARDEVAESVSSMLRRMGWVRKHLAHAGEEVRGIVVLDHLPDDVAYAAAGVGGAIAFKGYRMALTFHDLER